jgi:hypothetical protein
MTTHHKRALSAIAFVIDKTADGKLKHIQASQFWLPPLWAE